MTITLKPMPLATAKTLLSLSQLAFEAASSKVPLFNAAEAVSEAADNTPEDAGVKGLAYRSLAQDVFANAQQMLRDLDSTGMEARRLLMHIAEGWLKEHGIERMQCLKITEPGHPPQRVRFETYEVHPVDHPEHCFSLRVSGSFIDDKGVEYLNAEGVGQLRPGAQVEILPDPRHR